VIEILLALIAIMFALLVLYLVRKKPEPTPIVVVQPPFETEPLVNAIKMLSLSLNRPLREIKIEELPPDWTKAMKRVQSTAVDVQGMIDLFARYLILQMPEDAYKDLEPPKAWMKKEDL
jgi:hypothetical protein